MRKTKKSNQAFDFETAMTQLEQLVVLMENGKLTLEETLKQFQEGVGLIRDCQTALEAAQQKVQILTNPDEKTTPVPYESNEQGNEST